MEAEFDAADPCEQSRNNVLAADMRILRRSGTSCHLNRKRQAKLARVRLFRMPHLHYQPHAFSPPFPKPLVPTYFFAASRTIQATETFRMSAIFSSFA